LLQVYLTMILDQIMTQGQDMMKVVLMMVDMAVAATTVTVDPCQNMNLVMGEMATAKWQVR
jgi:hypothetical protein